ncbi:hypothetical protein CRG98_009719 [Punica granatum]|uniref:Protein kinase domain-containing protein n=2 Tax=Punica granatum TaxID=22663 RepID=A0A2I0KMY4_PUNGR|nr:hypothetical protein CRG98_009719 [Punica granatum]
MGDDDQKYAPLDHQTALISKAKVQPSAISTVPYITARLSRSEFSYSFPVTAGPKFLRLHFFPSSYEVQNFEVQNSHSDALFSFSKEFCVVVEDNQRLNLTFTPITDRPAAYALINGIEIISMPPDLYYDNSTIDGSREVEFLGNYGNSLPLRDTNVLETVYRINVGGTTIDPKADTGMFRSWTPDDDYLTKDLSSVLPVNWLHFCEFQREISEIGDRTFEIYIAYLVVDSRADVIKRTGRRGIPIYKDYAVDMVAPTSKKTNLTVSLHTGPEQYSVYADALFNGVEVFKISGDNRHLAGANPDQIWVQDPLQQPPESSGGIKVIAAIAGGNVSGALVLGLLCFLTFWSRSSSKESTYTDKTMLWRLLWHTTTKLTKTHDSSMPGDLCRRFPLAEIKAATNGFHEIFIVGAGGFGNVYKGYMNGGSTTVAIKQLNAGSQQGVQNPPLSWKQRLEICLGAVQGLQYLHKGTKHMIIHRDIKTTNILLDEKWVAKVSDFGLSKMRTSDTSHICTIVKSTFGYLDPEYFRFHWLTEKSDVYSFGVVLFEALCARPPTEEIGLAGWAQSCYQNGSLDQIIDPNLKAETTPDCLEKFAETAMSCLRDEGMKRPLMNDIMRSLELALQLQEGAVQQETIALEPTSAMDGRLQGAEDTESLPDMESDEEVLELYVI